MKYRVVKIFPNSTNGGSTGLAPIQVSRATSEMKAQKIDFLVGENFILSTLLFMARGASTKMAAAIAMTPPSLEGIARRMAYANKKYHSG